MESSRTGPEPALVDLPAASRISGVPEGIGIVELLTSRYPWLNS